MTKYNFLVFHKDFDGFLEDLMDLGVVHLVHSDQPVDPETEKLARRIQKAEGVRKRLEKREVALQPFSEEEIDESVVVPALFGVVDLEEELAQLNERRQQFLQEIDLLSPWGGLAQAARRKLEQMDLAINFFDCPARRFQPEWEEQYPLEIINQTGDHIYFVIFHRKGHPEPSISIVEATLPRKSLAEAQEMLAETEERIKEINRLLDYYASHYLDWLVDRIAKAKDRLNFDISHQKATRLLENKLVTVEGFCPKNQEEALNTYLASSPVLAFSTELEEKEKPPVLLKNNWFSRLFEPIGKLYSLPGYDELDLTPLFAPFFLLFFGFCLGDMGYGVVALVAASLLKLKAKPDLKPYLNLVQLFGLSTMVIGFFSGTLFGLEMAKVQAFESLHGLFLQQDQLFEVALWIGFLQILFGIGVRGYKAYLFQGWVHTLSPIGWIILLLSLGDMYVTKLAPAVSSITVWIGLALVLFFGNPAKGPVRSVLSGLGDLYNITGVLGDLLSYVRLFALGVSSAILGLVVNSIGASIFETPYIGWVLAPIFLLIGHTANMLLASLSAFVHPMRLTFVEFYKNAGFEGGGKPYSPFARISSPSNQQPSS